MVLLAACNTQIALQSSQNRQKEKYFWFQTQAVDMQAKIIQKVGELNWR